MNINTISSMMRTNSSAESTSASTDPAADKNLFMKLLVAQLKNQDPLSPQDGTAFVAQLAQMNSLEQLTSMRQTMDELLATIRQQ